MIVNLMNVQGENVFLVNIESVIGAESSFVNSVLVVCLAFVVAGIFLNSWIDFHFRFDLILAYFVFVNLRVHGRIKNKSFRVFKIRI